MFGIDAKFKKLVAEQSAAQVEWNNNTLELLKSLAKSDQLSVEMYQAIYATLVDFDKRLKALEGIIEPLPNEKVN